MNELAEKKVEVVKLCYQMTPEQLSDYFNAALEINLFAEEMKRRFAVKMIEGITGWNNTNDQVLILKQFDHKIHRLANGEKRVDIDIANWAFIHWFNRKRIKIEETLSKEAEKSTLDKLDLILLTSAQFSEKEREDIMEGYYQSLPHSERIEGELLRGTLVDYDDPKQINDGVYYFIERNNDKAKLSKSPDEYGEIVECDFNHIKKHDQSSNNS